MNNKEKLNSYKKEQPFAYWFAIISLIITFVVLFAVIVASFSGLAWIVLAAMVGVNISYKAVMGVTLIICLILVIIRFLLK